MSYYSVPVYMRAGDTAMVVASSGKVVVQTGGQIVPNSETQATAITKVSGSPSPSNDAIATAVDQIIDAITAVGICATG